MLAAFTGQPLRHNEKFDGTPVTETDQVVEATLREHVERTQHGDGFLGEEFGAVGDSDRRWIVDPIDGTQSLIDGGYAWATQIALEIDGELALGVTSAPALGRWWGALGRGAWVTETSSVTRTLRVSNRTDLNVSRWSCNPPLEVLVGAWLELASGFVGRCEYVPPDPHGVLMLVDGRVEVCLQLEGAPWDYAAFAAIVRAAGGCFTYLDGTSLLREVRPAIFTNALVHADALDCLPRSDPISLRNQQLPRRNRRT